MCEMCVLLRMARLGVALLFLLAGGASRADTSEAAQPSESIDASALLDQLIAVNQLPITKPTLKWTDAPGANLSSSGGFAPRIVLGTAFASQLEPKELAFSLAHELAHIALDHHHQAVDAQRLNLTTHTQSQRASADAQHRLHRLEFEADALALQWLMALGGSLHHAEQALTKAYGKATGGTGSHPALTQRMIRLRSQLLAR